IKDVRNLEISEFLRDEAYAWSWALCKFFDTHPRYRERFRGLGAFRTGGRFASEFSRAFAAEMNAIQVEWPLFVRTLEVGYDIERAAIAVRPGESLASSGDSVEVQAGRGWQSSGVRIERDKRYHVTATGRFTVAQEPKPWVSEARGISFRYVEGRPLGMLLGIVVSETTSEAAPSLTVIPLGAEATFTAATDGTLYLRLNDSWSELSDNTGSVSVELRAIHD
ncbi:MAG: hypothetical protein ACREIV_03795, partial [Planctomycetaceae bacterium]